MNNNKPILIVSLVLVLAGFGIYMFSKSSDEKEITANKESMAIEKADTAISDITMKGGSYEIYGSEKLALAETGKVILFFRAPWCPTCRTLDADIRANLNSIPEGVTILDVDYDSSTALKQKYGVTYQHTLVQVDAKGNQLAKWSNSLTLNELLSSIK